VGLGSLAKIESKILGLSLAAQPAAFTMAVKRVRSSIAALYAAVGCSSNRSLHTAFLNYAQLARRE